MRSSERRNRPADSAEPPLEQTAPQPAPIAEVVALQQSAGNRAVARTLMTPAAVARQAAAAPAAADDVESRYRAAIAHKDWTDAANLIDVATPDEMDLLISQVTDTDELVQFQFMANLGGKFRVAEAIAAVLSRPPHAEHIRIQKLEHDWGNARSTEDWYELAKLTCVFNDPDIENHLAMLHLPELEALVDETKGPHSAELLRLTEPAERHRARKHVEMTRFAIDNAQWLYAVTLLNGLSDADQEIFVNGLTNPQVAAIAPLVYMMFPDQDRLYSRVNFRQHKSDLATAHPGMTSGVTAGGSGSPANVEGGTVTTSSADTRGGTTGWFGQSYSGPDATNMGWLQFLAREAEKFDAKGNSLGFDTSMVTHAKGQAEPRHWGTPSEPYWTVDTVGATLPFYDSADTGGSRGVSDVSATQQAMYDRPDPQMAVVADAFDTWFWETDVAKVVMSYHFVDYLVHGRQVVYKSSMDVVWSFTSATASTPPARTNTPGPAGPADKLSALHYAAVKRRFPDWRYLAHE